MKNLKAGLLYVWSVTAGLGIFAILLGLGSWSSSLEFQSSVVPTAQTDSTCEE
jgi:hypothetical protein